MKTIYAALIIAAVAFHDCFASAHDHEAQQHGLRAKTTFQVRKTTRRVRKLRGRTRELLKSKSTKPPSSTKAPEPSTKAPTSSTKAPMTCVLKAELGYPGWDDPDDAPYKGYNYDSLEVWFTEDEYCDATTPRPWCEYENTNATGTGAYIGNVDDYHYPDWADKCDRLQSELFTITGAADKTTYFHVYHWFYEEDYYYWEKSWKDHLFAATLSISNNSTGATITDDKGATGWQYPVDKKTRTHVKKSGKQEINPDYGGEFEISVTCDSNCQCHAHDYTTEFE